MLTNAIVSGNCIIRPIHTIDEDKLKPLPTIRRTNMTGGFCVYGECFTCEEIELVAENDRAMPVNRKTPRDAETFINEFLLKRCRCVNDQYGDFYVGLEWDVIGDDETGKHFRTSIRREIKRVFKILARPIDVGCCIPDTWY